MMLVQSPKHPVLVEERMESFLKAVEVHECVHVCLRISACMSDVCNIILLYLTMYYMTFSTYIWGALYVQNKNTVYMYSTYVHMYVHSIMQRTTYCTAENSIFETHSPECTADLGLCTSCSHTAHFCAHAILTYVYAYECTYVTYGICYCSSV